MTQPGPTVLDQFLPLISDALFVSSAEEDWALAEWVTLRLTAEGYRVWCARFPVLGGEVYPRHVDTVVARGCFCVIQVLSAAALVSPGVIERRAEAMAIARERNRESLILLDVDGLSSSTLDWASPNLSIISFQERWETGFDRLRSRLTSLKAPRPLPDGPRVAAEARRLMASRRSWHTVL